MASRTLDRLSFSPLIEKLDQQSVNDMVTNASPLLSGAVIQLTTTYRLIVEYNGSSYCGFQSQRDTGGRTKAAKCTRSRGPRAGKGREGVCTVQECIEDALVHLTGRDKEELRVRGAGRTDKGVHATGQVVAFDLFNRADCAQNEIDRLSFPRTSCGVSSDKEGNPPSKKSRKENARSRKYNNDLSVFQDGPDMTWKVQRAINSRLPPDICVGSVSLCQPKGENAPFEPRQNVKLKQYTYQMRFRKKNKLRLGAEAMPICNSGPHTLRRAMDPPHLWICPWALDESLLSPLCSTLIGRHDFTCFVHKHDRKAKNNIIELKTMHFDCLSNKHTSFDSSESSGERGASVCDVKFTLEAPGFRRSMARNLVGFVVDVCRGKCSMEDVNLVLNGNEEHASLVNCVPACGLCLSKVVYEKEVY